MKGKLFKAVSLAVSIFLVTASLSACGTSNDTQKSGDTNVSSSSSTQIYPIKGNVTLKYWVVLNAAISSIVKNEGETQYAKEQEKRTGVKVEYIHPTGDSKQALSILLASGDLPDIIENNWSTSFTGGPEKALSEGYIIKLNDYMDKFAPNFKKYMQEHPDMTKMAVTDDKAYIGFPFIRGDSSLLTSVGLIIRDDWVKELGMELPTTIDEYYNVLKAFKDKKGATVPLSAILQNTVGYGAFIGAYGIGWSYYMDGSTVKYGTIQPAYKDFLTTMKKWYDEKLLDNNFATLDPNTVNNNIMNGKSGLTLASGGGGLGNYLQTMKSKDPKFSLTGCAYPTLKKGEKAQFGNYQLPVTGSFVSITTKCKNIEAAVRFLDYGYSEEGSVLSNFGIEGVSYKMENSYPKYTDLITNNPDKLTMATALGLYTKVSSYESNFVQDKRYIEQYYALPQQQDALKKWINTDASKHMLPSVTINEKDVSDFTKINNDCDTYQKEMLFKFIMGVDPIDNFDKYVEQMKKLGIEKAIAMKQDGLNRYNKR